MRIYEVKKYGKAIGFARSFDQAKVVVREDDPNAKKNCSYGQVTEYTNGVEIFDIEIKPDKEGIINKLNSLLGEKASQPEQVEQVEQEPVINKYPLRDFVPDHPDEEVVNAGQQMGHPSIVPAIEYRVDDLQWPKKGMGRCLHCKKLVGFSGGWPCVNPPDAIRDK